MYLLKKLEARGLVTRKRSETDERNLIVEVTPDGEELKEKAMNIPGMIAECINITAEEGKFLYDILYKILGEA